MGTKALAAAFKRMDKSQQEVTRLINRAKRHAAKAVLAHANGQHKKAQREISLACDAEFEAFYDCEGCGGLAEALYPDSLNNERFGNGTELHDLVGAAKKL